MSQVFPSETQNISKQGKQRGLFISEHGLSAQPYLKQHWEVPKNKLNCLTLGMEQHTL